MCFTRPVRSERPECTVETCGVLHRGVLYRQGPSVLNDLAIEFTGRVIHPPKIARHIRELNLTGLAVYFFNPNFFVLTHSIHNNDQKSRASPLRT